MLLRRCSEVVRGMKFRPTAQIRPLWRAALAENARDTARFGGASTRSAVTRYRAAGLSVAAQVRLRSDRSRSILHLLRRYVRQMRRRADGSICELISHT